MPVLRKEPIGHSLPARGGVIAVTTGTTALAPSHPALNALSRVPETQAKSVVTITGLPFITSPLPRSATPPLLTSLVIRVVIRILAAVSV